jgi:hypothetical protein
MLNNWIHFAFYALLIIALAVLTGVFHWEYLYQTSTSAVRNEFREGWAYLLVYGWPVFIALAALTFWKRKELKSIEIVAAILVLVTLIVFVGTMFS